MHHFPMATHQSSMMGMPPSNAKPNETKPRLGKDEVEILEREFQANPKPTTQTKRQFAEDMGVDLARINVCSPSPSYALSVELTFLRTGFKIAVRSGSKKRNRRLMMQARRKMPHQDIQNLHPLIL